MGNKAPAMQKTAAIDKRVIMGSALAGVGGYYTAKHWMNRQKKAYKFNKAMIKGAING
jgi:hypothetical protein